MWGTTYYMQLHLQGEIKYCQEKYSEEINSKGKKSSIEKLILVPKYEPVHLLHLKSIWFFSKKVVHKTDASKLPPSARTPSKHSFHPPDERQVAALGQSFLETKISAQFLINDLREIRKKPGTTQSSRNNFFQAVRIFQRIEEMHY